MFLSTYSLSRVLDKSQFSIWSSLMLKTLIAALGLLGLAGARGVPQTINLQSRVAPPGTSLKQRALNPATVPLADFFLGTDLQYVSHPCRALKSTDDCLYKKDGLEI